MSRSTLACCHPCLACPSCAQLAAAWPRCWPGGYRAGALWPSSGDWPAWHTWAPGAWSSRAPHGCCSKPGRCALGEQGCASQASTDGGLQHMTHCTRPCSCCACCAGQLADLPLLLAVVAGRGHRGASSSRACQRLPPARAPVGRPHSPAGQHAGVYRIGGGGAEHKRHRGAPLLQYSQQLPRHVITANLTPVLSSVHVLTSRQLLHPCSAACETCWPPAGCAAAWCCWRQPGLQQAPAISA